MNDDLAYLTAQQTAAALGVTLPTLYAYVSRGLIASEAVPGEPRARRYRREEVERLQARQELRRHPEKAAPRAIAWGEPVLDSALTLIDGRALYYRGHDAVALSRERSVEDVAALLWTGDLAGGGAILDAATSLPSPLAALARRHPEPLYTCVERLQTMLPLAGAADEAAWDLRPEAVARCGARILGVATAAIAGRPLDRQGIAATLVDGWRTRARAARGAISAALVLAADHELNVSTFAARCVASAEATPWDAVSAGLAALKGRRHGGEAYRMAALLADAEREGAAAALAAWMRRGERLPGFGHRLYPNGDPRGAELLALAVSAAPTSAALGRVRALEEVARKVTGELPNVDLGLAAVAAALRLPPGAPHALFALGRTLGWIAHAIEEYGRGTLIRPRARYVGPPPQLSSAATPPQAARRPGEQ